MSLEQHLKDRYMDVTRYTSVWVDEETQTATFGLYNLSGKLVGYQQYKPFGSKDHRQEKDPRNMKYFTHATPEGKTKSAVFFGAETVNMMTDKFLFVTEGVFDAVRIHNCNLPAIAVLSNDPEHLRSFLRSLPQVVVAVCDDDKAGRRLGRFADEVFVVPNSDLGDLSQTECDEFVSSMLDTLRSKYEF